MSIPCEFKTYGCRVEIQYKDKESVSGEWKRENTLKSSIVFGFNVN